MLVLSPHHREVDVIAVIRSRAFGITLGKIGSRVFILVERQAPLIRGRVTRTVKRGYAFLGIIVGQNYPAQPVFARERAQTLFGFVQRAVVYIVARFPRLVHEVNETLRFVLERRFVFERALRFDVIGYFLQRFDRFVRVLRRRRNENDGKQHYAHD